MTRRIPLSRCKRCPHYNGHICNLPDLYPCVEDHNIRIKNRFLAVATIVASILIALCLLCSCGQAPESEPPKHWSAVELLRNQHRGELSDMDKLVLAIGFVESRWNPDAVGNNNDLGFLQITPVFCAEASRVSGADFRHEDAFSIDSSLAMFAAIQRNYNGQRSIEQGIYHHNKSGAYRARVLEAYEMVDRYETIRAKLIETHY